MKATKENLQEALKQHKAFVLGNVEGDADLQGAIFSVGDIAVKCRMSEGGKYVFTEI